MKKTTLQRSREQYEKQHKRKKITFTLEEYHQLQLRFFESGQRNMNQFIKKCALQSPVKDRLDNIFYKEMIMQLRKIGTNINQIAYQLNAQLGSLSSGAVEKRIDEVKEILQQILKR